MKTIQQWFDEYAVSHQNPTNKSIHYICVPLIFFSIVCILLNYTLAQLAPLWVISIVIFAAAWVGQFYGHQIEGQKPSFMKDLQFLLIGPAWVMNHWLKKN